MAQRKSKDKDTKAKETVSNLLKGVLPKEAKPKDKLETAVKEKGIDWLQDDIDRLTQENDQLRADYDKLFKEHNDLKNQPAAGGTDTEIKQGVLNLFRQLEDAHLGRNPERVRYKEAIIRVWLEKFLQTFPFISEK